jgi:hypothetical protein
VPPRNPRCFEPQILKILRRKLQDDNEYLWEIPPKNRVLPQEIMCEYLFVVFSANSENIHSDNENFHPDSEKFRLYNGMK